MGYRHVIISDTLVPIPPEWFVNKYSDYLNFNTCWSTNTEYKLYGGGYLESLFTDIQLVINEERHTHPVRLVCFADGSEEDDPDIRHVIITKDRISIIELFSYDNKDKSVFINPRRHRIADSIEEINKKIQAHDAQ